MAKYLLYIISGILAYCLGSVSVGIIVSRIAKGPDLHTVGSKNTGASNVLRTMGWKYGLITFFGDCLKAILACLIGKWLIGDLYGVLFCGIMVILGHNWPVFFAFKGGKGVASSCGVMLICFPVPALIGYICAIAIIALTKYISLGSMCMLVIYAVTVSCCFSGGDTVIILWSILLAIMCLIRHRTNIIRLVKGNENKFGQRIK